MSNLTNLQQALMNGDREKILEILQWDVDEDDHNDTLMHLAFRDEEITEKQLCEVLDILLDRGADINVKNRLGKTILHLAIERRMRDVIEFCLERNADMKVRDHGVGNPLAHFLIENEYEKFRLFVENSENPKNLEAFENESSSFVDWMVSKGFDFFLAQNIIGKTPLYLANDLNLQHILLTLLKRANDLPAIEKNQLPLLCAFLLSNANLSTCGVNHTKRIDSKYFKSRYVYDIVKIILEKSTSIDGEAISKVLRLVMKMTKDDVYACIDCHRYGEVLMNTFVKVFRTPTSNDHPKILRALLANGADVNELLSHGLTFAQILFDRYSTIEMLEVLKEAGADFKTRPIYGSRILYDVDDTRDSAELIEYLVNECYCDVNIINGESETPLRHATINKKIGVAKKLIECGAKVNLIDVYDETPLNTACTMNQIEIVRKLIEYGANLKCRNKYGWTCLHVAAYYSASEIIPLLIDSGADVNARDIDGKTALHLAINDKVIRVLFERGAHVDVVDNCGNTPLSSAAVFAINGGKFNAFAELLKCGADILHCKVFARASNQWHYPHYCPDYLEKYLIKMIAAGFYNEIRDAVNVIGNADPWKTFSCKCQAEVELIKKLFIDKDCSLYELLYQNRIQRRASARNDMLKQLIDDGTIEKIFPNYFVLIVGSYNRAATRESFMEQIRADVWFKITGTFLPDLCLERICMYLSNADMASFLEAYNIMKVE